MMTLTEICEEVDKAWEEVKAEKGIRLRILMNRYGTDKLFMSIITTEEYERHLSLCETSL